MVAKACGEPPNAILCADLKSGMTDVPIALASVGDGEGSSIATLLLLWRKIQFWSAVPQFLGNPGSR